MTPSDVARRRVRAQRIDATDHASPADVVRWLGAVQAQDYAGALWAVRLRMRDGTAVAVERALAERAIVRTWPLRGTLHLVAAEDARWMLAHLAPRVIASRAPRHRALALDDAAFGKSRDAVARALEGGRSLARDALYRVLRGAGVSTDGQRGVHVLQRLALEGLICFAARDGTQQTFALLEEWLPRARALARDEALAALAGRYFAGHGPATAQDFAWWSGLSAPDAREALELARPALEPDRAGGRVLWTAPARHPRARAAGDAVVLLPPFDELLVGYRDRSATLDPAHAGRVHALLSPTILVAGRVVGTWTRRLGKGGVVVTPAWFGRRRGGAGALAAAVERYARFLSPEARRRGSPRRDPS